MHKQEKAGDGEIERRSKVFGELSKAICEAKESGGGSDHAEGHTGQSFWA